MDIIKIFFVLTIGLLMAGCAGRSRPEAVSQAGGAAPEPPPEQKVCREAPANRNGSLWSEGQGSMFLPDTAHSVGDILTVAIYERASAEKEAETSTGKSSAASMGIPKLFGYEAALAAKNPNFDPSSLVSASVENSFEGSGTTSREERLSATLTAQVVSVLDSGNLRIKGSKTVRVNNENQIISLTGIVRPEDITADNMIDSKYVLDAEIEYTGNGVLSDKQRPGWLVRVFDVVWPF